eukprot:scaffold120509_cov48-Phaeocystis_antarctica.AAC.1
MRASAAPRRRRRRRRSRGWVHLLPCRPHFGHSVVPQPLRRARRARRARRQRASGGLARRWQRQCRRPRAGTRGARRGRAGTERLAPQAGQRRADVTRPEADHEGHPPWHRRRAPQRRRSPAAPPPRTLTAALTAGSGSGSGSGFGSGSGSGSGSAVGAGAVATAGGRCTAGAHAVQPIAREEQHVPVRRVRDVRECGGRSVGVSLVEHDRRAGGGGARQVEYGGDRGVCHLVR